MADLNNTNIEKINLENIGKISKLIGIKMLYDFYKKSSIKSLFKVIFNTILSIGFCYIFIIAIGIVKEDNYTIVAGDIMILIGLLLVFIISSICTAIDFQKLKIKKQKIKNYEEEIRRISDELSR